MESLRVPELKAEAKSRGLRGYSKFRKAELINLLKQSERPMRKVIFVYPEREKSTQSIPKLTEAEKKREGEKRGREVRKAIKKAEKKRLEAKNRSRQAEQRRRNAVKNQKKRESKKRNAWKKRNAGNVDVVEDINNENVEEDSKVKFELVESKSALKGFAKQYTVRDLEGVK